MKSTITDLSNFDWSDLRENSLSDEDIKELASAIRFFGKLTTLSDIPD